MTMKSPTLALLEESGAPITRENFLNLAFLGDVDELDAEEESELPIQFQLATLLAPPASEKIQ